MSFVCPECARLYPASGFCTEDGAALVNTALDPMLGRRVGSHCIARPIGAGGMGEVYLGVHPDIGSRVAIKLLSYDCARVPQMVDRFFAEARAVNVIRHEGIVSVTDLSRLEDGRPYIVMEFLDGAPLSRVFDEQRPMPLGGFVQLMLQVLDALGAAHAQGITHRDLKPDNVFVTATGRAKLLDFGIAKLRPDIASVSEATRTGALLGTPFYMSPEQAQGQHVDARSDLYSLGVMLFEGVTGRRPFQGETLFELLRQQIQESPVRPSELRPDLPPALESVILRCLEKDPARRIQTAGELAAQLRQAAQFLPAESFHTLTGRAQSWHSLLPASPSGPLPPTAPGVAQTLPQPGSTTRAGVLGVGVGLAFAGVLVLALLVVGGGALYFMSERGGPAPIAPVGAAPRSGSAPSQQASSSGSKGIDLKHFDAIGYYPEAEKLARGVYADAGLTSMSIDSPDKDGLVDVTEDGIVSYSFRSPKQGGSNCLVSVTVTEDGAMATAMPISVCFAAIVKPPSCALSTLRAKMGGRFAADATLTYGSGGWTVVSGDDIRMIPDDCGAASAH
ncbi:MAG: serine/threonine protein kinase [Myxococcales bacterium]|nr:serine/threonine protein kinase [Myxococcales bacterium]MCB9577609.1 serine/threonine protein kinase [Polyangiaceae bacterium]